MGATCPSSLSPAWRADLPAKPVWRRAGELPSSGWSSGGHGLNGGICCTLAFASLRIEPWRRHKTAVRPRDPPEVPADGAGSGSPTSAALRLRCAPPPAGAGGTGTPAGTVSPYHSGGPIRCARRRRVRLHAWRRRCSAPRLRRLEANLTRFPRSLGRASRPRFQVRRPWPDEIPSSPRRVLRGA